MESRKIFLLRPAPEAEGYDTNPPTELLSDDNEPREIAAKRRTVVEVAIDDVAPSPFQTRDIFDRESLEQLRDSILSHGIIQPILVREIPIDSPSEKSYELIAGERRFRAAQLAGLKRIPAIVSDAVDRESMELLIIENAQREGLNAYEEARAYEQLATTHGLSHSQIARAVGKNRTTITNSIRLLQLPPEILELLKLGTLSAGHGRALLPVEDPDTQLRLARLTVTKSLSVRALETMIVDLLTEESTRSRDYESHDYSITISRLSSYLGIEEVRLKDNSEGLKQLTLTFPSDASWKRFLTKIRN